MARDAGSNGELNHDSVNLFPAAMVQDIALQTAVIPFMESAIRYGIEGYGPRHYLDLCETGKAQLWGGFSGSVLTGIMVTMMVDYSDNSVLRVLMCAGFPGSLEKFSGLAWGSLCQWARELGATHIEAWGRNGWERALERLARPEKSIQVLSYRVPE